MTQEFSELNREATSVWEKNASWWDAYMGEDGNRTHRELVAPAAERLLEITAGETVLEAACGAGIFARRMAELGAYVVAFDASAAFLEAARERTAKYADLIELHHLDATDEASMLALGQRRFDAAVCNMALMDIADIRPLASVLSMLLKLGGRLVFSVPHPCFNMASVKRAVEEEYRDEGLQTVHYAKVSEYITPKAGLGIGIAGQPVPQYYFDRPLSVLFKTFFDVGFVMDAVEEPINRTHANSSQSLSWSNFSEIPSVMVARMILLDR